MNSIDLRHHRNPAGSGLRALESIWADFWFSPLNPKMVQMTRTVVGTVSLLLFVSYSWIGNNWFTDQGWFDSSAGLFLVGNGVADTGAEFRMTPFYQHPNLVIPVSIVGMVASLALLLGRFASLAALVAFVCLMFFHHRAPLLVTKCEPLVSAFLLYLAFVPTSLYRSERGYLATVGIRLMQIHFVIWIWFSLSIMLANEGWWTGESVRRLLEDRQGIIPSTWGTPFFAECLSSLVIISQVVFLACVARPSWRHFGFWAMLVFTVATLIVMADWMYAMTILAGVLSLSMLPDFLTKRFAIPS
ncbi:MAG: hypothetical protein ACK5YR_20795 [Pirellula sp.]|jgi:uncharacterized membrane protein YphA (DoxX/SURF4 family)